MDVREWIIVLAIILMVVLAADAWRRVKRQQKYRGNYRTPNLHRREPEADIEVKRVAARDERSVAIEERTRKLQLTEKVPMLVDSVESEPELEADDDELREGQYAFDLQPLAETSTTDADERRHDFAPQADVSAPVDYVEDTNAQGEDSSFFDPQSDDEQHTEPRQFTEQLNDAWVDGLMDSAAARDAKPTVADESELPWGEADMIADEPGEQMLAEPEAVIVITVLAREDYEFTGAALLEILLACGMRFGNMNIFHATDEQGLLQYSAANAFNPGTFDIDNVEHFATRGVTFFLQLPCQAKPLDAFDAMYHTARTLGEHLRGDLYDDSRSVMTAQTLEHYRERIRDFQRTQLVKRV
ncbi:cell division protein ZipA [Salinispirillum sp. LH 10-3-1]|uniref:Cell division protein ZipA n=1 Tax=Salinispirillum sp. LH 10-3-1 TaxID=2952525 RepID=A0AB38YC82_9GAMM